MTDIRDDRWLRSVLPSATLGEEEAFCERVAVILEPHRGPTPQQVHEARTEAFERIMKLGGRGWGG